MYTSIAQPSLRRAHLHMVRGCHVARILFFCCHCGVLHFLVHVAEFPVLIFINSAHVSAIEDSVQRTAFKNHFVEQNLGKTVLIADMGAADLRFPSVLASLLFMYLKMVSKW